MLRSLSSHTAKSFHNPHVRHLSPTLPPVMAHDNICSLPLTSDLFAQVLHPTEPILTIGLSSGHVQTYRLPAIDDDSADSDSEAEQTSNSIRDGPVPIISNLRRSSSASENGLGSIDEIWKTRRHKGSCRALAYSHDGAYGYSAGTDGLVKCFETQTGKVVSKIAIPEVVGRTLDAPTVIHALSPQGLLLGTDSGRLYLYDLRQSGKEMSDQPSQTWTPHGEEHVNSLIPLPVSETSTSGFPKQWVSVGGTTLAVTDLRKGIVSMSEDQEVELTCVNIVQGLKKGGTSVGEKVVVGQGDGVASLWEKGVWGDLDERVVLDREEAGVECIVEVPMDWARKKLKMNEKMIATGLEDGRVRFMRIGRNGVLNEWDVKHDEIDGVVALGFDVGGRMVSGGGQVVKVWTEAKGLPGGGRDGLGKHTLDAEESEDEGDYSDSSNEEKGPKEKRKRRKRNKGKDKSGKDFEFSL